MERMTDEEVLSTSASMARNMAARAWHWNGASAELILLKILRRLRYHAAGGHTHLWGWVGKPVAEDVIGKLKERGFNVITHDFGPDGQRGHPSAVWLKVSWAKTCQN